MVNLCYTAHALPVILYCINQNGAPMRGEIVSIDLETTGLDISSDSIIEVGAVRTVEGAVIEEFSTLINPGLPVPPAITHLTGITSEAVLGKPGIETVLPLISEFVGSAPILAHNVTFDASFLARHGILQRNPRIDTYDLASILLPRAARYNLNSLAADFDIAYDIEHRALSDARATAQLYWHLWQKTLNLPYEIILEITEAARGLPWDTARVFEAALLEHRSRSSHVIDKPQENTGVFAPLPDEYAPLRPNADTDALDLESLAALISDGGPLARTIPNFERREQQVNAALAVGMAFNHSMHVMIEAGTGTGKSVAYLLPSILWAVQNGERVVVSTNTINLQDQLITKDLPALVAALETPADYAVLKGRSNYLCPRRLAAIRRRHPTSVDELRTLAKILVWLLETTSGDRGEISLRGPIENLMWQRLSAEDEGCTLDRCRAIMGGACPFYKARRRAEAAHIIVVNHALLLSDAATDNRVLPEYNRLILDEAHHLEDAVTNSLSFRLDEVTLRRRLADLGSPDKGLLGDLLRNARASVPDKEVRRLSGFIENISLATGAMHHHIAALFSALRSFVGDVDGSAGSDYATQIRVTQALRERGSFAQVQSAWVILKEFVDVISEALYHLAQALPRLEQYDLEGFDDLVNSISAAARYFQQVNAQVTAFVSDPDDNTIYWVSASPDRTNSPTIHSAPLHVGPMMNKYLWATAETIVMTSATLRTGNSFDYISDRLHADHFDTLEVGSPFNYRESTLVYVPNDIPEPNDRHRYQQSVERGIIELASALNGRVMALFTSYGQLRQTSQAIGPRLALGGITIYDQSDGTSRQALLEGFKSTQQAVLLGTRSFWEGVDIPGESLSALVIVRLPFAVPSDPIFAARSETYTNSFDEYAVPEAVLRFRQGFGRLIRTSTDRGIVAIFDRRIISKGYGASFLEALPDCTVEYGTLDALPTAARTWLNISAHP